MVGTSVSSGRKEDLVNENHFTETVHSEKHDDFISDSDKNRDFNDSEKSDFEQHGESFEDSPIEEVRAVVSK